jgi:hypothetical protein
MRPAPVTHAFDVDQRYIELPLHVFDSPEHEAISTDIATPPTEDLPERLSTPDANSVDCSSCENAGENALDPRSQIRILPPLPIKKGFGARLRVPFFRRCRVGVLRLARRKTGQRSTICARGVSLNDLIVRTMAEPALTVLPA